MESKNGIIYYIKLGDDYYIGSTQQKLSKRQGQHNEYVRNKDRKSKLYETARGLGFDKIKCIVIENILFYTIEELRQREEFWRRKYKDEKNSNLNCQVCFQTLEEKKAYDNAYNQSHKDRRREWYLKHKDDPKTKEQIEKRKEWEKLYGQTEKRKEASRLNANQYYNKNKDEINEKRRIEYEENKTEMREKANKKKECPICKKIMNGANLARHIKGQH
jgi:hypothetical protein